MKPRQSSGWGALAALAAAWLLAGPAQAAEEVTCTGSCDVDVTAEVPSKFSFSVTITELIPDGQGGTEIGPVVTEMDFSELASQGTFDHDNNPDTPEVPRSLSSTKAYQVFFGINSQQRSFTIKQTAGPLQSGADSLPDGAFIVTPLEGVGGDKTKPLPGGIEVGDRGTAVEADKVLFSSSGGPSDTMAATYGVTDDPKLGAFEFIPLDQPAGDYVTNVTFTATVL